MKEGIKPSKIPGHLVGKHIVHHAPEWIGCLNGKHEYRYEDRDVILMAATGNWAMVRRPRCMPYCCKVDELNLDGQNE